MRILSWALRLVLFFLLFAFALNNQHEVSLKGLFGTEWRTPMVFVVMFAFALGCAIGVLAMVPSWWRQRRAARLLAPSAPVLPGESTLMPPDMVGPRSAADGT